MSVMIECGCGEVFEAVRRSKYKRCAVCAARAKKIRQDKWRERQRTMAAPLEVAVERRAASLVVVDDPLRPGGFREGTLLTKEEWRQMLRLLTFTPGTLLRDGQGRLYEYQVRGRR